MASASFTLRAVDSTKAAFASVQNNLDRLKSTARVAGQSLTKSLDLRGAMTAVSVAVGLSVNNIADKVARLVSGTSAAQEMLANEGLALQEKLGQLRAKNFEDRLSDEQLLMKLEQDRAKFASRVKTDAGGAIGTQEYNDALQNQISLEETISKIGSQKIKTQDSLMASNEAYRKSTEDLGRAQAAIYSGKTISIGERILDLRTQEGAIMHKIASTDIKDTEKRTALNNELVSVLKQIAPLLEGQSRLFRQAGEMIAFGFEDAILSGQKLGEVIRSLGRDLLRLVFNQMVTQPLASGISGFIQAAFTPRAMGGPVSSGSPYLVGEEGPELFVPNASGTIVPNNKMGSGGGGAGGVTINYNIASGVSRAELVPILDQERRRLKAEIPDMVRRGGAYRAAFA